ncbi:hypothetical protein [Solirhodobacter olei]|uniref:hypothetical protein n=1 Tax=Solirhodobacter olei TaxID=2493082 RepID=UPI000FD87A40|nr:hypothetical protein [Solirhodobacter olei]
MEPQEYLPAAYVPALLAVLKDAGDKRRQRRVVNVIEKYEKFCRTNGSEVRFTVDLLRQFQVALRDSLSSSAATSQFRVLYRIGLQSADLGVRDWLFENAPDSRTYQAILASPWWPDHMRLLAPEVVALRKSDGRLILAELDNYLRYRQRHPKSRAGEIVSQLFLTDQQTALRKYLRIGKLVIGLELLDPHTRELADLRSEMLSLYRQAYPPKSRETQARRLPVVEDLLERSRTKTKRPYSPSVRQVHRVFLTALHDVLRDHGRGFALDRAALDIFVDHVFDKHDRHRVNDDTADSWTARTCQGALTSLLPYVEDEQLRSDLKETANHFGAEAKLEIKSKERKLAEKRVTLDDYFARAGELLREAMEETRVNTRSSSFIVAGLTALLVFYPLRRADVRLFRVGIDVARTPTAWQIIAGHTLKTGAPVEPVQLPSEATPFLDGALLQGIDQAHLWEIYRNRIGLPLFPSRKSEEPYNASRLGTLFKEKTNLNFGPHILRTLWTDELVADGADRLTIQAMLQQRSLISQKEYEVFAAKIRRRKAVMHVANMARRALAAA